MRLMPTPFVHLHNHSEFSLLDGASKIKDMVKYAVEMDMPAIALTDHGVMYGAFEFYKAARAAGIKGIVGCELYVATRGRTDRDPRRDGNHHLVALAKNEIGYKNLMKLVTKASLEGFYYKPRVDKELLAEHHEGLIISSACMGGELAQAVMKEGTERGKDVAAWYREVFGDDFYLEVQGHHADGQWNVNEEVRRIARAMGIKMVATNDSHYLRAEDASAHDVLICVQTGTTVNDPKRMRYEPREFYLKPYSEMMGAFETFAPDAIENTLEVASKIELEIETGRAPMPVVGIDEGGDAQSTMERLAWEGLERRLPKHAGEHKDRLDYELDIVKKTGFAQYFLIVRDIAQHARQSGIFFGVRGSAAGSLASYCLGITDLDPVEYDLTFERFLNPERVTMPDIDMDFEDTRRGEVIEHVTKKYGKENVAYITTFGTLGAKAAIRDAGRALDMPLPDVDRIARMVPAMPLGLSIDKAMRGWPEKDYAGNPEMVAAYENEELAKSLLDTARQIEGITRTESVHAAGIMISDRPLVEYTPLRRLNDGSAATQYPHSSLESIGLLKMDFLGLVNLSILGRAVKLIAQTRGDAVDVWNIPLHDDDPRARKAYDMLGRGETTGIFQLESAGMRKYIVELKPNSVKELSAMVALYRPGPLAHIPRYIRSKFDPSQISYTHPLLEPILKDTYGVIVYQDQVLKIVQAVAGFSLGQADLLRRAMGKKSVKEMEKQREAFHQGAKERGIGEKVAGQIFAEIEPFAGYAFNGAHAACYAMVAYQTAYLKANYPAEYLAALMASYIDKTEKVVNTIEECERLGIEILPPDVNASNGDFLVSEPTQPRYQGAIRFGLLAIKNIGRAPIDAILAARAKGGIFTSLDDFCRRVFAEGLTSKSVVEMLIKAGAFRSIHPNIRSLIETLDDCVASAQRGAKDAAAGLMSLWGDDAGEDAVAIASIPELPDLPDYSRGERLSWEKEYLGLYLTEHPVKPFEPELRRKHRAWRSDQLGESTPNQQVVVGGMVAEVRTRYTKSGQAMLNVVIEDTAGSVPVTFFPKAAAEHGKNLLVNSVVVITGKAQHRERIVRAAEPDENASAEGERNVQIELIADKLEVVVANAMAADARPRTIHVRVDAQARNVLRMVKEMLGSKEGGSALIVHAQTADQEVLIRTNLQVDPDDGLLEQVRRMLGGGQRRVWVE
jgi:DNA polymerase-3 subunit alpha